MKVGDKLILDGVEIECMLHDGACKGYMHWAFQDCAATLRNSAGEELGEIVGTLGAGLELRDRRVATKPTFFLSPYAMWKAFQQALLKAGLITETLDVPEPPRKDG
jgi:hypothetical protein